MKALLIAALVAVAFFARPALADDLSYDDPAMHYRAPDGWKRVSLGDPADGEGGPAAVFAYTANPTQPRSVTITIAPFTGPLSEFSSDHQNELRQTSSETSSIYIEKKENATLANGMPVVRLVWTSTSDQRPSIKNYETLFIDGQRSISVKYSGFSGDIGDLDAASTLSSLYAVAYPHRHADTP